MTKRTHFIVYGRENEHKAQLEAGLKALGPKFLAQLCWWCDGTTRHKYESCNVCGKHGYCLGLGLLVGNEPAPHSVVNQVLVAAEKIEEGKKFPRCGRCDTYLGEDMPLENCPHCGVNLWPYKDRAMTPEVQA